MNARKVLEMGGGTLLISLPKEWVKKNGVAKGATLAVEEISARKLMIRPIEHAEEGIRATAVQYPGEGLSQVTNDITGAYLLGFDVIRVEGRKVITREDRALLKSTIGRLVGLEVMDEDSRRLTLQFLLEPTAFVPEKIVKRMSGLLDGMLKDTADGLLCGDSKLLALVAERDDEVDRLYFLLVRATRAAIVRPEVAEGYGLSPVDLLDYRVLASFLESAGDAVTELSSRLHVEKRPKSLAREYAACVGLLKAMNELATRAFVSRRARGTGPVGKDMEAIAKELSGRLARIAEAPAAEGASVAATIGALDRVGKLLMDVSDLAVIAPSAS